MKKVLIVEDENDYREILKKKLINEGYFVLAASNGQTALDLVANNSDIDLILLDLLMPGMDGITFFYNLKVNLKRNIPTLILTNLTSAAYNPDIKEFVIKANTSLDEVVEKVAHYTSQS